MSFNYDISKSGMFAALTGIKVTQNNIANSETQGYARERVALITNTSAPGGGVDLQIGAGVIAETVERLKNDVLIQQSRNEGSSVGYYGGLRESLSNVEAIFGESYNGSISNLMNKFFDSWQEVAKYPEQKSYRDSIIGVSKQLTDKLNSVQNQFNVFKNELDGGIQTKVNKINELISKIANVNKEIGDQATNPSPNALIDERDRYLDQLSEYGDMQVSYGYTNKNLVDVKFGGATVVAGPRGVPVRVMKDTVSGDQIATAGSSMIALKSGSLVADLESRNQSIPSYETSLNKLVSTFVTQVNALHSAGYGLDNSTGNAFFTGMTAASIGLNPLIENNPQSIATASVSGSPANVDMANKIAALQDANLMNGGTSTMIGYWSGFSIEMATKLSVAKDNETAHDNVKMGIEADRQSVQGVNMDEELSNLMKYQKYFEANAKTMKTVDDTYSSLMNII